MRLPVSADAPAEARNVVREAAPSPNVVPKATLLASEIVSNAVRHAGLTREDTIGFALEVQEGSLRVGVSDDGPGFEKPENPVDRGDGGFGLAMVERLSDRWGVSHDGANEVWFEIDLPPIPASE